VTTVQPTARPAQGVSPWLVLVLVCLAQFMVVLDATIVNVALPSIQADLDFSVSSLQWVVNAYTLVFGGFLLLGGRAADLIGRRRLFLAGIVLFSIASLLCGLATSSSWLIGARALQGLGAALVSPAALSIVINTFPDGPARTKALSAWAAIAVGGGAVGLLLGGILTEYLAWEWIFFVNVPVGVVALLLSARYVPESRGIGVRRGFDLAGAVSVTGGLMLLVYGIVKAQDWGWGSARTLGVIAAALVLLATFLVIELRSANPLVRLGIFRKRSLASANGVMLVVAGGLFAMFFLASLYVQQVLDFTPVEAGLAFLPLTAGIVAASVAAQQLIARLGVRPVVITGLALATVGLLLLAFVSPNGTYAADVLPGILVMAVGLGLTFVPLTLIATTNVAQDDAGLASGLFNTSQQVGGALGLAILSTLAASRTESVLGDLGHPATAAERTSALVDGFQVAFAAGAGLTAIGMILVAVLVRRRDVAAITAGEPAVTHA